MKISKNNIIIIVVAVLTLVIGVVGIMNPTKTKKSELESQVMVEETIMKEDSTVGEEATTEETATVDEETTTEEEVTTNQEKITEEETTTIAKIEVESVEEYETSIFHIGVTTVRVVTESGEEVTTAPQLSEEEQKILTDKTFYDRIPDIEINKKKIQWLRENYGDSFTCGGREFNYSSSYEDFVVKEKTGDIHIMTSTSTSTLGYNYINRRYYRVAEYLGYYGTDHALYGNEEAFEYMEYFVTDKDYGSTEPNVVAINEAYVKELGWTEKPADETANNWTLMTTEGVPVTINADGYIKIYILYPDTELDSYLFTIEEYKELVSTYKYYIRTRTSEHYFAGSYTGTSYTDYIYAYATIDEIAVE